LIPAQWKRLDATRAALVNIAMTEVVVVRSTESKVMVQAASHKYDGDGDGEDKKTITRALSEAVSVETTTRSATPVPLLLVVDVANSEEEPAWEVMDKVAHHIMRRFIKGGLGVSGNRDGSGGGGGGGDVDVDGDGNGEGGEDKDHSSGRSAHAGKTAAAGSTIAAASSLLPVFAISAPWTSIADMTATDIIWETVRRQIGAPHYCPMP
jgi:hypothetical protein